jgi:hypothetical protein
MDTKWARNYSLLPANLAGLVAKCEGTEGVTGRHHNYQFLSKSLKTSVAERDRQH